MTGSLTGVIGPLITTFYDDADLDLESFEANLRAHLAAGLDGVVVCGSTGEAAFLDDDERAILVDVARSAVPADSWLIVGTGAESTRACVRRCKGAASRGADAVLVVAPHYYGAAMTGDALRAHYTRVADESPVPVLLYNIPKYMHFRLEPDLVRRLAEHPNIVGMKDSSGDMTYLAHCMAFQGDGFAVLTGNGSTWSMALSLGARGGILAVALFAPELSREVWRDHQDGRAQDADETQRKLTPLATEIVGRMGVAGVKAAMDRVGLMGGRVRSPLLPLSAADASRVVELLRDASVAPVA
jgi:4-hydroxy-tetrahydrodipicolinate synthase